jgi:hypothetical protein
MAMTVEDDVYAYCWERFGLVFDLLERVQQLDDAEERAVCVDWIRRFLQAIVNVLMDGISPIDGR